MNELSAELTGKIRALRNLQNVSAQKLADRMAALGFPIQRNVLANIETGRRQSVSVDFVSFAAQALDTTFVRLLTDPVACPGCGGKPPVGFTCNTCGGAA
ncbi:helix-turn-helix domain-containing protein [Streptomyces sp. H27-H5]|uniref:helix-turn-helix domain-containing protein n=1 Tax=Streptomyces sp. H27-H5 TaxID=2996460 RepID=UPI0022703809|nr:helix-turn-helix transcriptional regulator [Streptomyces sp. H27-H5]MCY0960809.1 helix-turn-helix transcriptional regulator [Streptomyces sp. H27-H5]